MHIYHVRGTVVAAVETAMNGPLSMIPAFLEPGVLLGIPDNIE